MKGRELFTLYRIKGGNRVLILGHHQVRDSWQRKQPQGDKILYHFLYIL